MRSKAWLMLLQHDYAIDSPSSPKGTIHRSLTCTSRKSSLHIASMHGDVSVEDCVWSAKNFVPGSLAFLGNSEEVC